MSDQTKSNVQDHENEARILFQENPNITIEGFCARMQQRFEDLNNKPQLLHYYNQARANCNLISQLLKMKDLARDILDNCTHILTQTKHLEKSTTFDAENRVK